MTMALVACGTKAPSSPVNEVVETESDSVASEPEQATEAPVDSLVADNVAIDGEFGDATGITVEKLDVAECEAFASYITDKTTAQAVYDIGLTDADKNAVQPDGTVNVTITVPDEMIDAEGDNYLVYFINADAFSQVEVVSVTSDTVTFETEHFSVYAVVKFDSNVMSETDFVRNSEEIAETASTPETSTEENSEAVSEPDSEAVVEPEFTVTELTATKYAVQSVNVRSGPSTDYDKIGGLTTNQEIQVTGQASTGWYRFTWTDGREAYVSDRYVSDEKIEVTPPASNNSGSGSEASNTGSTSGAFNEADFPTPYAIINKGGLNVYFVMGPDPDMNYNTREQCIATVGANLGIEMESHGAGTYYFFGDYYYGGSNANGVCGLFFPYYRAANGEWLGDSPETQEQVF